MTHSRPPFLLGLACMCALLSPTATTALGLPTPLHSHIRLGDDKCVAAPENVKNGDFLVVVNCADRDPTDARLRFVFDTDDDSIGKIKLFANQTLCVNVPSGQLNIALQVWHCGGPYVDRQFRVVASPERIHWQGLDGNKVWTLSGDRVVIAVPSDDSTQAWKKVNSKVYPFVRIELDGNKCLFAPETHGNGVLLASVVCSDYAPTDPRLRFMVEDDNNQGFLRLYGNQNFCVNVPGGNLNQALQMLSCEGGVRANRQFVVREDKIQWLGNATRPPLTDIGNEVVAASGGSADQGWTKLDVGQPTRIQLGNNKCIMAPSSLVTREAFKVVNCDEYAATDIRLEFVFAADYDQFEFGHIKLHLNPDLCVDVPDGGVDLPLAIATCASTVAPINRQFRVLPDMSGIQWEGGEFINVFTLADSGDRVVVAASTNDQTTQHWRRIDQSPRHRIALGGIDCLSAPTPYENGRDLQVVKCADYAASHDILAFVFDADDNQFGQIKLFGDQDYCIDVEGGLPNAPLQMRPCVSGLPLNRQFRVLPDLPGIQWEGGDRTNVFTRVGTALVVAPPRPASQRWTRVNPTIKLLELDAGNVCAETPTDANGNRVIGQLFAAQCDLNNINQQFIMHPNGVIEVNDGPLLSNVDGGLCLGGSGTKVQTVRCYYAMQFTVDATAARIRWQADPELVVGFDNTDSNKPKLGFYVDTDGDRTQKWRPSLGDAAVMIKSADNDLCLDRSFQAQPCAVKPSNTCSRNSDASITNVDERSFVLYNGGDSSFTIMAAEGGNHCAKISEAEGSAVQMKWCDYKEKRWFRVNAADQRIVSTYANWVFTLENDVVETNTSVVVSTPTGRESQRWDVFPARSAKCMRHCLQDGGDGLCPAFGVLDGGACSAGVCVEGLCGDEEGIYGKKAICCGEHGIDPHCLNARANLGDEVKTDGNWCMTCTGNDYHGGLTGCSTPKALPQNGQLPATGTHLRCSFRTSDDGNNIDAALSPKQPPNTGVTYLAITGIAAKVVPLELSISFENLKHLDLAGSGASGFLLESSTVDRWKQLEHLNVSECTNLCLHGYTQCFHSQLGVMTSFRVLDMSSMGLSNAASLGSLKTLTSLEELYLNDNALTSLPANFFDNMTKLTKLRVRGNPISTTLPPEIYTRVPNFDCDVAPGTSPDTPLTASPTKKPTVEQPSAYPTSVVPRSPTTPAPTAPTSQPSAAPSAQPTSVKESAAATTRSPSVASAAAGDNTLVFALAGVAVMAVVIVIVVVVMLMKQKAAHASTAAMLRTVGYTHHVADPVLGKLARKSEEHL